MGYFLIVIGWVLLDQWSKYWTITHMALDETIPVVKNVLHLTYVNNYGAAFSILQNKQVFLILLTAVMMIGLLAYMFTERKKAGAWVMLSLSLIVGGGIGNLIDRVLNGYVVDMIDFRLWSPVFNVADIGVTVGCILLLLAVFFSEPAYKKKARERKQKKSDVNRPDSIPDAGSEAVSVANASENIPQDRPENLR